MIDKHVEDYWVKHYVHPQLGLCSLCGNTGHIDTTNSAVSPSGVAAGRVNFCLCPNGQRMREVHDARHR